MKLVQQRMCASGGPRPVLFYPFSVPRTHLLLELSTEVYRAGGHSGEDQGLSTQLDPSATYKLPPVTGYFTYITEISPPPSLLTHRVEPLGLRVVLQRVLEPKPSKY